MSAAPGPPDAESARRRRWVMTGLVIGLLVIALAVIGTAIAVWLFFFGAEAPAAPTLDDALQVLRTTVPTE